MIRIVIVYVAPTECNHVTSLMPVCPYCYMFPDPCNMVSVFLCCAGMATLNPVDHRYANLNK